MTTAAPSHRRGYKSVIAPDCHGSLRIHHIRAENPDSGQATVNGLCTTPVCSQSSRNAYGTIASGLAISFASRVVQEATRRPRQLMGEPRPCSSTLSIQGSWMWDGCVGIVLGFDTKDSCVVVVGWLGEWLNRRCGFRIVSERPPDTPSSINSTRCNFIFLQVRPSAALPPARRICRGEVCAFASTSRRS